MQWLMQDFPDGMITYYFAYILQKLHENEKNGTERERACLTPPRSANAMRCWPIVVYLNRSTSIAILRDQETHYELPL